MFPKRVVKSGGVAVAPFRRRIQRPFPPRFAAFQKHAAMKAAKRRLSRRTAKREGGSARQGAICITACKRPSRVRSWEDAHIEETAPGGRDCQRDSLPTLLWNRASLKALKNVSRYYFMKKTMSGNMNFILGDIEKCQISTFKI